MTPHLKGHLLRFDAAPRPGYSAAAGARLLLVVLLLEGLIGPRLWIVSALRWPDPPDWLRVPLMLALALILVRAFTGLRSAHLGLRPWREWSTAERSYLVQGFVIANVVFASLMMERVRAVAGDARWGAVVVMALTQLAWGFYQELIYRGMLQTELARRWGTVAGILAANLLYTFGPLHFYHASGPAPAPMFAAIFAIGLFFAVVFARSGNLWMVGLFHGVGDIYLDGLGSLAK